jgi:single-stranded-DNA-specific exonuclease
VGARVVPFIPGRADGYGLGERGLEAAREAGASVLVTVDTGIRAVDAVDRANSMGLDVIILDHHELGDRLPAAWAVVNPLRGESVVAFRNLAAVGVAAKFMHALALADRPCGKPIAMRSNSWPWAPSPTSCP